MPSSSSLEVVASGTYNSSKDRILAEINPLQQSNPSLYRALRAMVEDLDHVVLQLNPITGGQSIGSVSQEDPPDPTSFGYTFTPLALKLSWTAGDPIGTTFAYEIRDGGTGWDDATFVLRTTSLSCVLDPHTGTKVYRIKALNINGDESPNGLSVNVPAVTITAPSVSAQVIDNNVLLSWTAPSSSYNLSHYALTKNGSPIGTTLGTFFTLFETSSGTNTYGVAGVDIAGNTGTAGTVVAIVDQPPDFELLTTYSWDVSLGSHASCYYEANDGKVYGPVDLTETYETHFSVDQSWASPQAQVDAGYDYFIQENEGPGTWTSTEADLGSTIENVIINIDYSHETLAGTNAPTIGIEIRGSTTPGGGSFVAGQSQFFTSVRYVAVRFTLTPDTADSFCRFWDVGLRADVKNTVDGNVIYCNASDASGTTVNVPGDATLGHGTKTFSDINSITVGTVEDDNEAVTVIYDFTDAPNPTQFSIYCFDNAGRRVDANVSWKVRGIQA